MQNSTEKIPHPEKQNKPKTSLKWQNNGANHPKIDLPPLKNVASLTFQQPTNTHNTKTQTNPNFLHTK